MKNTFKKHGKDILKKYLPHSFWKKLRSFYWYADRYITIKKRVKRQKQEDYQKRRLLAIYDFTSRPFTFDTSTFLINAELQRRKRGLEKIDVAFVAHASDPGSSGTTNAYINKDNFRHYLHNFAIEMTRLFDSVGSIFVFDNRRLFIDFFSKFKEEYFIFPEDYNPLKLMSITDKFTHRIPFHLWINSAEEAKRDPTLLCLTPPKEQINIVRKWILRNIYPNIPITITLREWGAFSWKNNNVPEWQKLIDSYKDTNIKFIVLRDYYKIYDEQVLSGSNIIYYNEPLLMFSLRAALYQECVLNLFCVGGCIQMVKFNRKSNYIIFKVPANAPGGSAEDAKKDIWAQERLRPGDNLQGSTKYQKYVWEPDTFEIMKPAIDKMIETLKEDGVFVPKYYEKFKKNGK